MKLHHQLIRSSIRKAGPPVARFTLVLLCLGSGAAAQSVLCIDPAATGAGNGNGWANAYPSLDVALLNQNGLVPGSSFLLAEGTYTPGQSTPGTQRSDTFLITNQVGIYGGYLGVAGGPTASTTPNQPDGDPRKTILSGDLENTPSDSTTDAYHVITVSSDMPQLPPVILDGLTITSGNANGSALGRGGGIIGNRCHLEISDCRILDNNASSEGGGVSIYGQAIPPLYPSSSSTVKMKKCVVKGNSAGMDGGGVAFNGDVQVTIFNTRFSYNGAGSLGGGLRFTSKYLPVTGQNPGSTSQGVGSFLLANSVVHDNEAFAGGGVSLDHMGVNTTRRDIVNCTIAFNHGKAWAPASGTGGVAIPGGSGIDITNINQSGGYFVNILNSIVVHNPDEAGPNGTGLDNVWSASPQYIVVDRCDLGDDSTTGAGITPTNSLNPSLPTCVRHIPPANYRRA